MDRNYPESRTVTRGRGQDLSAEAIAPDTESRDVEYIPSREGVDIHIVDASSEVIDIYVTMPFLPRKGDNIYDDNAGSLDDLRIWKVTGVFFYLKSGEIRVFVENDS